MEPRHFREELACSITHGIGALLSVAALVVLVVSASGGGTAKLASFTVFGVSLVLLYTASTCYHSCHSHKVKRFFRKLDHAAIYLLIAGTYTPFTLLNLRGGWGWTLFGLTWSFAAVGIALKAFFVGRFEIISTLAYLAMGWLVVIAAEPTLESVRFAGIVWMAAGGLAYTFGVIFYALHRMPYNHAVWHLFVMTGSACHFVGVLNYALP